MPDFDTRNPHEPNESNGLPSRSLTNSVRNFVTANRLRTLWVGEILLFVVVAIPFVVVALGGENGRVQECDAGGENGRLVFLSSNGAGLLYNAQMYMINADGTNETHLTKTTARKYGVYDRSAGCGIMTIRWLNSTKKDSTKIDAVSYDRRYSPDGTKKVFARREEEEGEDSRSPGYVDLYMADADGRNETQITDTPEIREYSPTWSPDGKTIAYASRPNHKIMNAKFLGLQDIFVMNVDSLSKKNLTETPAVNELDPIWSPDSKKIAFSSSKDYTVYSEYVMNSDGSGRTRLTMQREYPPSPFGLRSDLTFSPDSTKIAYSLDGEIVVENVGGSGRTRLTLNHGARIVTWLRAKNE
jgi:dipeptidyl aminopeptidase/acylaminoacyl peptidase